MLGGRSISACGWMAVVLVSICLPVSATVNPVGMTNKTIIGTGLSVTGLLVTTWGSVTSIADDGSYVVISDGSTDTGLMVMLSGLSTPTQDTFEVGKSAVVTGLVSKELDNGASITVIRPRGDSDITGGVVQGLNVDSGVVTQSGQPYRGIGVDYCDAFTRTLANQSDTSYQAGFATLAQHHIPFVRMWAMGYWPTDNALYFSDKEGYFQLLDGVVKSAEDNHVGIIFSMFFNYSTVPDLVHEPCDQWGNPDSQTQAFMRQYIDEIANRYGNSHFFLGVGVRQRTQFDVQSAQCSRLAASDVD